MKPFIYDLQKKMLVKLDHFDFILKWILDLDLRAIVNACPQLLMWAITN